MQNLWEVTLGEHFCFMVPATIWQPRDLVITYICEKKKIIIDLITTPRNNNLDLKIDFFVICYAGIDFFFK